jgi:hypothetical protein
MKKELYVVEFSSANYAGAPEHCRVWAYNEDDAKDEATSYAEDFYMEQDQDQWEEENPDMIDEGPGAWASMDSAVPQKGSEYEEFIANPEQALAFYPIVN